MYCALRSSYSEPEAGQGVGGGAGCDGHGVTGKRTDEHFGVGAGKREINREVRSYVVLVCFRPLQSLVCVGENCEVLALHKDSALCLLTARMNQNWMLGKRCRGRWLH